ncbi:hybrid sensor histidine kinase/response regulator [Paraburkholderia mimosarum]|uniref:ATP-binding response regulator n=1 Tax=Paraburkholderia mimosarum TaxID=312026 RepID=UPI000404564A|nr:hybrid sensor histidine kinase/response regulator [Paraburkholderia mimosarum]
MTQKIKTTTISAGVLTAIILFASATAFYYIHNVLLSPKAVAAIAGPQENYFWGVGQFQISLSETMALIAQKQTHKPFDVDGVTEGYQMLLFTFDRISDHSEATRPLYAIPGYSDSIKRIGTALNSASSYADHLDAHGTGASEMLEKLNSIKPEVQSLARRAGDAEVAHREALYREFMDKRIKIDYAFAFIGILTLVLFILTLVTLRQQQRTIATQRDALRAENKATQAANDAARAKNAFLGMIGHELRTPLQSIVSVTDTLLERSFAERDAILIQRLAIASGRLESQMKDLTDYARLDAGGLKLREQEFQPENIIRSMIDEAAVSAARKGLDLDFAIENGDGWYVSDPDRIRQIFGNLLSNAIRYTDTGKIFVAAKVKPAKIGAVLDISVEDTGPGIPAGSIDRLFEPFTQLDESGTRKHDGAGIGLAIVKGLVSLLGGTINLDTQRTEGTKFTVSLPVKVVAAAIASDETALQVTALIEGRRILVVDDHESARESFADVLCSLGAVVEVAENAQEALSAFQEAVYDAVLLDIQMPGEDGIAVARKVRTAPGPNRDVPIIGVSALPSDLLDGDAADVFTQHLLKPVRSAALKDTLLRIFSNPTRRDVRHG